MKLKIVSDGMDRSTKVVNAETGEVVEGVTSLSWHCAVGEFATVEMKLLNVSVDVVGHTRLKKPRRRIEA